MRMIIMRLREEQSLQATALPPKITIIIIVYDKRLRIYGKKRQKEREIYHYLKQELCLPPPKS